MKNSTDLIPSSRELVDIRTMLLTSEEAAKIFIAIAKQIAEKDPKRFNREIHDYIQDNIFKIGRYVRTRTDQVVYTESINPRFPVNIARIYVQGFIDIMEIGLAKLHGLAQNTELLSHDSEPEIRAWLQLVENNGAVFTMRTIVESKNAINDLAIQAMLQESADKIFSKALIATAKSESPLLIAEAASKNQPPENVERAGSMPRYGREVTSRNAYAVSTRLDLRPGELDDFREAFHDMFYIKGLQACLTSSIEALSQVMWSIEEKHSDRDFKRFSDFEHTHLDRAEFERGYERLGIVSVGMKDGIARQNKFLDKAMKNRTGLRSIHSLLYSQIYELYMSLVPAIRERAEQFEKYSKIGEPKPVRAARLESRSASPLAHEGQS